MGIYPERIFHYVVGGSAKTSLPNGLVGTNCAREKPEEVGSDVSKLCLVLFRKPLINFVKMTLFLIIKIINVYSRNSIQFERNLEKKIKITCRTTS